MRLVISQFFTRIYIFFAAPGAGANGGVTCGSNSGVLPSLWDGGLCGPDGRPQITSISDFLIILGNAIRILIAVSGMLVIVFILAASIYYIISAGDAAKVKKAKDILQNLVTGLVVIIAAYAILTFVSRAF